MKAAPKFAVSRRAGRRPASLNEQIMSQFIKHIVATAAAAVTTFALFSGVAALADDDKAALIAAHVKQTLIAAERSHTTQQ